jgi:ribosomal protein S18 acetylase RimI-like enzyme
MMMDAPLVRQGRSEDIEPTAAIKVANWAETYAALIPPAVLARLVDRDHALDELRASTARPDAIFLVAEDGAGSVLGFALAYLEEGPDAWLESLHVAASARGRGVGTELMIELARILQKRGYRSLSLGVVKGNAGAGRLYTRLGASLVRVEPTTWAEGVDHEVYRWVDLAALARAIYNPGR